MIEKIQFKNYKVFKGDQTLELRRITVLIGKNSSGKSAVLKLPTLIEGALSGDYEHAIDAKYHGVEAGSEFRDLVYGRRVSGILEIGLHAERNTLNVEIGAGTKMSDLPEVFSWKMGNEETDSAREGFAGIVPSKTSFSGFKLKTQYLSSDRLGLERAYERPTKTHHSVGLAGENVYGILVDDAISLPQALLKRVSKFYQDNFEGWGVAVNQDRDPFFQIELVNDHLRINLKEVGLGMVHALPIVTQAYMSFTEDTLLSIEEPELHLHPAAHGNLAELIVDSLSDPAKRYLIETHSQNFVLRLRRLVAEGKLPKDDLLFYYVDFDDMLSESALVKIEIDDYGKPRNQSGEVFWPNNIFSETLEETSAIRTAQINRTNGHRD